MVSKLTPRLLETRAALLMLGLSVDAAARALECNPRSLWALLRGETAPKHLIAKLERLLGPAGWAYAVGQSDRLPRVEKEAA